MSFRRLGMAVLALAISACSASTTEGGFELSEFSVVGPGRLVAGEHTIAVANNGMYPHTLVVTDAAGQVVGATSLVQPGETASLEVDLADGQYSFTCRIVAEDSEGNIVDHYEKGMNSLVDVSS